MSSKPHVGFGPQTPAMQDFFRGVQQTLVQQPDYRGIGGHGLENHGGHGWHTQTDIGIKNMTVDFRNPLDPKF